MNYNSVSMGATLRGQWVAVRENGSTKLIGPFPSHAEANAVAKEESCRVGLQGLYRGA